MKSGDEVRALDGTVYTMPYAGEHPCFLSREGCTNMAVWRGESAVLLLHFCEVHKKGLEGKLGVTWERMESRND